MVPFVRPCGSQFSPKMTSHWTIDCRPSPIDTPMWLCWKPWLWWWWKFNVPHKVFLVDKKAPSFFGELHLFGWWNHTPCCLDQVTSTSLLVFIPIFSALILHCVAWIPFSIGLDPYSSVVKSLKLVASHFKERAMDRLALECPCALRDMGYSWNSP